MKKGLGKGLDALLSDNSISTDASTGIQTVSIYLVEPNRKQPRKYFDKESLQALAESIAENGLLQPLVVRPLEDGRYQIISGERRWRASRMAGLIEIPVVLREEDDRRTLELGLIENLQREDLNGVEEAEGYRILSETYGLTQGQISKKVGKSRSAIANALRILALPENVLQMVLEGRLSAGHARTLLPLCDSFPESEVIRTARAVAEKNLSVRETEALVKSLLSKKARRLVPRPKNLYLDTAARDIGARWGRKVKITAPKGQSKGRIELEFYGDEDLNELIQQLLQEGE